LKVPALISLSEQEKRLLVRKMANSDDGRSSWELLSKQLIQSFSSQKLLHAKRHSPYILFQHNLPNLYCFKVMLPCAFVYSSHETVPFMNFWLNWPKEAYDAGFLVDPGHLLLGVPETNLF
jgi:hypothetical protein